MLKKILIIIILLFANPLVSYSQSSDFTFSNFLNCFKETSLPIIIDDESYGDEYAKTIHENYIRNYFDICCFETKGLDRILTDKKFVVLIYKILAEGASIGIVTFTSAGELIDRARIARYHGDIAGKVISKTNIDQNLNIVIENKYYDFNPEFKSSGERGLKRTEKQMWHISQQGFIIK